MYDYFVEAFKKLGPVWTFKLPFRARILLISDPKDIEHVLKTNFENYQRGQDLNNALRGLLGEGIFNADGQSWFVQRKVASQIFNVRNFRDYFSNVFREEAHLMLKILKQVAEKEQTIDLCDLFHRYTLDSFAKIAFGVNLNILQAYFDGDQRPVAFASAFDRAQNIVDTRIFNPFYSVTERLTGAAAEMRRSIEVIDKFAYDVIRTRRKDPNADQYNDLLSRFMSCKADDTGRAYTDVELRDIVMNMIIAGRDTTAQALSWTFFRLNSHPKIVEKLREEAKELVGEYFSTENEDVPTYEQTKQMTFARAVFSETLRLHPSVPKQGRVAMKSDVLPSGVKVDAGTLVAYASYCMGRDPKLWGADASEYKPERFVNGSVPSQYKYVAFNAGPRVCLGMNMAYIEAMIALTLILRDFDVKLAVPESQIKYGNGLTLSLASGLPVHVRPRTHS